MTPNGTRYDGELSRDKKLVWDKIMMEYVKQEKKLYKNCQKAYALIFGKCANHMQSKLETHEDCQIIRGNYDVFLLVGTIKGLTFKSKGHKHPTHALNGAKIDFYHC